MLGGSPRKFLFSAWYGSNMAMQMKIKQLRSALALATGPRRALIRLLCLAACGLAGCGLETYEQRLEATKKYFAYLDKLDQSLSPPWRFSPIDGLRVPRQFQEIPAPQPITNSEGKQELPEVDPRQPDFLNWKIEGLVGAWQTPVDVVVGDQREARTAYLYAVVNSPLFQAGRTTDALAFSKNLMIDLANVLQIPPPEDRSISRLSFPKEKPGYLPKLDYDAVNFRPEILIQGAQYDVEYYAVKQGDNQVAFIILLPRGMDPQSRISERIPLMLESLRVSPNRPQATPGAAPANSGGGTPSATF